MDPLLGRHKFLKVMCWALNLSAFNCTIEHFHGDSNTRSDIMSHWMNVYRKTPSIRRIVVNIPFSGVTNSLSSENFKWTLNTEIEEVKNEHADNVPFTAKSEDSILILINGSIFIPD